MKNFCLTTAIAVFLMLNLTGGIQGQNLPSNLDQPKLMMQFLGKWQSAMGKDTVEVWECQVYGKAFTSNVYQVIKGQKHLNYTNNISFNPKEAGFYGFQLTVDGNYGTWIGAFTTEKKLEGKFVQNFNPETIYGKFEILFKNANEFTWTFYNQQGVKVGQAQYVKSK